MEHQQTHSQPTCLSDLEPGDANSPTLSISPTNPPVEATRRRFCHEQQVYDVNGLLWDVREVRATKHGFDLLLGFPVPVIPKDVCIGRSRFILTPPLVAYCEAHRMDEDVMFDLPASRGGVQNLRQRLGFNYPRDRRSFWEERAPDLKTLSLHEFVKRHNVPYRAAQRWRKRLHGSAGRPLNWWHDPAVLQILRSGITLREVGIKLGISSGRAHYIRSCARARDFNPNKPPNPTGRNARPRNWWHEPAVLEILRSPVSLRQKAHKLGISIAQVHRLRHRALAL